MLNFRRAPSLSDPFFKKFFFWRKNEKSKMLTLWQMKYLFKAEGTEREDAELMRRSSDGELAGIVMCVAHSHH